MDDDRGYPYDSGNLLTQLAIEYDVAALYRMFRPCRHLLAIEQFTFQTIFQIEIEDKERDTICSFSRFFFVWRGAHTIEI